MWGEGGRGAEKGGREGGRKEEKRMNIEGREVRRGERERDEGR